MPWQNNGDGERPNPWGNGPRRGGSGGGGEPPNIDEYIRKGQERIKSACRAVLVRWRRLAFLSRRCFTSSSAFMLWIRTNRPLCCGSVNGSIPPVPVHTSISL
ncbi:protease modulator HflK N-terminal domain-containing protein [Kordiimonas gwangyangensis]|uniref:protease modulator HflK N-terminal domain-containing protein n=1 Tax=Kordiimonas gwangyangensis TaxID=288022 RepID=UPI0012DF211E